MADGTLSVLADILQKDILPDIQSLLPKETMLYDQFCKNQKNVSFNNNKIYFTAAVSGHTGVNSTGEGGDVGSGRPRHDQMEVEVKTVTGSHKLTVQAIKNCKGQPGALADVMTEYGVRLMEQMGKDFDRQFTSFGEGVITTVITAGTVTTLEVDNAHALLTGETYEIDTKANIEAGTADSAAPTDVDIFNNTVTIASTTVLVGDRVVKESCHTTTTYYDMMGIAGLVDKTSGNTTAWQGVTRAGASYVNSYVNDTAEVLALNHVTTMVQASQRFGSPDFILGSEVLQNKYASELTQLKRVVNKADLVGGWSGIAVQAGQKEIPFMVNYHLPSDEMYCIDADQFKYAESVPLEYLDEGEGVLKILPASSGQGISLQYQAVLMAMGNLVNFNPRSSSALRNKTSV